VGTLFLALVTLVAPQTVRVHLYNQSRFSQADLDTVVCVANRLWRPYGIQIERSDAPESLVVTLSGERGPSDGRFGPAVLGTTLFVEHHAVGNIHLWLGAAEAISQEDASFRWLSPGAREAALRRMVGAALAHELGHYLLDTNRHASRGLLQQIVDVRDLETADPARLPVIAPTDRSRRAEDSPRAACDTSRPAPGCRPAPCR
jgi:hypothetical protein